MPRLLSRVLPLLLVLASSAGAQLAYDGTVFLHGLNDPFRWHNSIRNIPAQMSSGVVLKTVGTPDIDGNTPVNHQSSLLRSALPVGTRQVVVGHSMGGLVARNLEVSPDGSIRVPERIAAIVTVATPHQGAPVAANGQRPDPVFTAKSIIDGFAEAVVVMVINPLAGLVHWIFETTLNILQNWIFNKIKAFAAAQMGAKTQAAFDIMPGSATINRLNAAADAKPHMQVVGRFPAKDAWLHMVGGALYLDGNDLVRKKNSVAGPIKVCKKLFYNFIIKTGTGKLCHRLNGFISEMDVRWNDWTHGPNKSAPFDGLVPEDYAKYPQAPAAANRIVQFVNHFTIIESTAGQAGVIQAMRTVGMPSPTPPPPPPGGGGGDDPPDGGGGDPDCPPPSIYCEDPMRLGSRGGLKPRAATETPTKPVRAAPPVRRPGGRP